MSDKHIAYLNDEAARISGLACQLINGYFRLDDFTRNLRLPENPDRDSIFKKSHLFIARISHHDGKSEIRAIPEQTGSVTSLCKTLFGENDFSMEELWSGVEKNGTKLCFLREISVLDAVANFVQREHGDQISKIILNYMYHDSWKDMNRNLEEVLSPDMPDEIIQKIMERCYLVLIEFSTEPGNPDNKMYHALDIDIRDQIKKDFFDFSANKNIDPNEENIFIKEMNSLGNEFFERPMFSYHGKGLHCEMAKIECSEILDDLEWPNFKENRESPGLSA